MRDFGPTLYDQLGVTRDADEATLKRAWRAQLRATHPDTTGVDSHVQYDLVQRAWDVLGDPARRAQYDAWLDSRDQPGPPAADPRPAPPSGSSPAPEVTEEELPAEVPAPEPGRRTTVAIMVASMLVAAGGLAAVTLSGADPQDVQMTYLCAAVLAGVGGWTWRTAGWRAKPMLLTLATCGGLAALLYAATLLPADAGVARPLAVPVGLAMVTLGMGATTWRLAMRRRAKYVWSFD